MKTLTAFIIFLASFSSFACPFHGGFDEHDYFVSAPVDSDQYMMETNLEAVKDKKTNPFLNRNSFESQLELWKKNNQKQQD